MMKRKPVRYSNCENCGGKVVEKRLTVDHRFHEGLFEFENVPVGVCRECSERVYKGPVLERLERLAQSKSKCKRTIQVRVIEFENRHRES